MGEVQRKLTTVPDAARLDIRPPMSDVCDPTDARPTSAEVERLIREWAEVGRAILVRRKKT